MYIIYTQCRIARSEISFLDGELRKLHTKLMLSREHSHCTYICLPGRDMREIIMSDVRMSNTLWIYRLMFVIKPHEKLSMV